MKEKRQNNVEYKESDVQRDLGLEVSIMLYVTITVT